MNKEDVANVLVGKEMFSTARVQIKDIRGNTHGDKFRRKAHT